MGEGWLVQESCVWIFEYLEHVDKAMPMLWRNKPGNRLTNEVHKGKGLHFCFTNETREKYNHIVLQMPSSWRIDMTYMWI